MAPRPPPGLLACRRPPDAPEAGTTAAGSRRPPRRPLRNGEASLPTTGLRDPAFTYEMAARDPARYRAAVTWVFVPCSAENQRMMCALDMPAAMGPAHSAIYVVEFASPDEAGRVFREAAFAPGCTATGTVAGAVDQHLVVRGPDGRAQPDVPKVTVPLLVHPVYTAGKK